MTPARLLRILRNRFRSLFRPGAMDDELARELAFHLDQLTIEYQQSGLPHDAARQAARRALGNVASIEETCRDRRAVRPLLDVARDLEYGLRMLRRSPGFTVVAVASLALAMGANAAILGVIDTVLYEPLPFRHAERLVVIRTIDRQNPHLTQNASLADYLAWRTRAGSFDAVEGSLADQRDFAAMPGGPPAERIFGQLFTPGLFDLLGTAPLLGRTLGADDLDGRRPRPVVVISHRLWQRRFGGSPEAVGRRIRVNGADVQIVGVMPPAFRYPNDRAEYWAPMQLDGRLPEASSRFYMVLARLQPRASAAAAQSELDAIAAQLARERPEWHDRWLVRAEPLRDALFGWARRPLFTLQAATALILLMACANLAGLLLARGCVRAPEIAARVALGAGRGRIVRQLAVESLLLGTLGALAGVAVAWITLSALGAFGPGPPPGQPAVGDVRLNLRMIGSTALLGLVTSAIFGTAPALLTSRLLSMNLFTRGPAAARTPDVGARLRGTLVSAQLAAAFVLLTVAGLLVSSFTRLSGREINLEPDGLLAFEFSFPAPQYTGALGTERGHPQFAIGRGPRAAIERLHERLRSLPGSAGAAGLSYAPINSPIVPVLPAIRGAAGGAPRLDVAYFLATSGFFSTAGTPVLRGRDFDDSDTAAAPWVAIVNDAMARRFWPGEDPIGQQIRLDVGSDELPRRVVGVVADIPVRHTHATPQPIVYAPYLQQPDRYRAPWAGMFGRMFFVVRTSGDPGQLAPAVARTAAEIAPDRPIYNVVPLARDLRRQVRDRHAHVFVIGALALAATLLAAIGVYGVVAFTAARRRNEIGVRLVLGARSGDIVGLIGRGAMTMIAGGLLVGLGISLAVTRLLASQLWGITPTDPATFAAVSAGLSAVALTTFMIPARRAMRIDPAAVLRAD